VYPVHRLPSYARTSSQATMPVASNESRVFICNEPPGSGSDSFLVNAFLRPIIPQQPFSAVRKQLEITRYHFTHELSKADSMLPMKFAARLGRVTYQLVNLCRSKIPGIYAYESVAGFATKASLIHTTTLPLNFDSDFRER
jgi:hypothetical protein